MDEKAHELWKILSTAPVISQPNPAGSTTISIPENITVGEAIYSVVASDADGNKLHYNVVTDKFSISNTSGEIQVSSLFDYEDANDRTHVITIQVSDGINVVNVTMTILVTDVNDNSPQFYPSTYAVSTDENTPAGTSLLELNCTDVDSESNGYCTMTIQSGDLNPARFNIIGNILYTTTNLLDYETKSKLDLIILGQDSPLSGTSNTATAAVAVTVNNVNEPPFLAKTTTIEALNNNGMNIFSIYAFTGIVALKNPVDYELVNLYEIVVVVTDYGSLKGTGTVTVSILDVNDNGPVCSSYKIKASVSENVGVLDYDNSSFYQLKVKVWDSGIPVFSTTVTVDVNVTAANYVVPWIETTEGIATTVTCTVLGLVCIVMAIALIKFAHRGKCQEQN
ncbi:hypothetical protein KUTeg_020914 [Tegillarca granosa]|uniref:Cadherin domain-containing protein n=1 Tax=Tegillarca granosa TaxID=220873 RepID=A0ABQ9E9D2_TEGGR|nr:hypothetical protein KUTeg_020914 [Tegillarca granosa]